MKNIFRHLFIALLCLLIVQGANAEEYKDGYKSSKPTIKATTASCAAASGFRYLDVNNVNARINTGGTFPVVSEPSTLFLKKGLPHPFSPAHSGSEVLI